MHAALEPPATCSPAQTLRHDLTELEAAASDRRRLASLRAIEAVQQSWRTVRRTHGGLRDEVVRLDSALDPRRRQLAVGERRLVADLIALHRRVFRLVQEGGADAEETYTALAGWIARCREQLDAHARLLQDAHYRDRGFAH